MGVVENAPNTSPMIPSIGWNVVHLFLKTSGPVDIEAFTDAKEAAQKAGCQVVTAAIVGHKADVCVMALGGGPVGSSPAADCAGGQWRDRGRVLREPDRGL